MLVGAHQFVFGNDSWDLGVLKWKYPQLFSFAKKQSISLLKFLSQDVYANFFTQLSDEAAAQWNELADLLNNLPNLGISEDSWSYIWGTTTFTRKLAYKQLQGTCVAHPLFSWLWKSCGRGKHKFFGWLLFCDRLILGKF
jgi:hypothetical protein